MYQRQQNTLYRIGVRFCENNFLETSDWFTAYNRGKVFDLRQAGQTAEI